MRQPKDPGPSARHGEAGFSLVEMLITAFILAIGLLGLMMLQTMTLRVAFGSRSMGTAIKLGQGVSDQIEAEGRQLLLFAKTGNAAPTGSTFFDSAKSTITLAYDAKGNAVASGGYYTVTVKRTSLVTSVAVVGGVNTFVVTVDFADTVQANGTTIPRKVTLNRQVAYA